jgi:HEAT repeat protein
VEKIRSYDLLRVAVGRERETETRKHLTFALSQSPVPDVKRKAVFALTQLPGDGGIPKLIQVARTNRNPEVREQAIFWLGQSKDPRALDFIEEILLR